MSDDNAHTTFSDTSSQSEHGADKAISGFDNNLNGYGEPYTPEQLTALKEYLSFLADLTIQIYYEKHIED
jgi:hypothetical protein